MWNPTKNCTKIAQEQLNKMHRLEFPNSTPIQNKKLKNSNTIWKMKNNTDLRRTQKENDKEILIFEEP